MKNFQKKENNLNILIDKLSHIHKSYSHFEINNDHLLKWWITKKCSLYNSSTTFTSSVVSASKAYLKWSMMTFNSGVWPPLAVPCATLIGLKRSTIRTTLSLML